MKPITTYEAWKRREQTFKDQERIARNVALYALALCIIGTLFHLY